MKNFSVECLAIPGRSELWDIVLEGEAKRRIHRTIFGKSPKFPSFSSKEEWPDLFNKVEYQAARRYIIWRLTKQSYHSEQLFKMLLDRLVQKETAFRLIEEFKQNGYLEDEMWIERYLSSKTKKEGLSKILNKLRMKGLSAETLQTVAEQFTPQKEEEKESLLNLLKSKYKNKNLSDFKEKNKVIASLLRKGFSYERVKEALLQFLKPK